MDNSGWTNRGLEKLIDVVNKLRDCCSDLDSDEQLFKLDLPQIAVVGGQSAGKSSVLENFVGREFLPRGSGIVTRRPLVLQLVHKPAQNSLDEDYGEFGHARGKRLTNFEAIRREIELETERCIGKNKAISPKPIHLRICSQHVLNLTLIDLPGLTKVPVGDQPINIEQQIRDMILTYIKQDNCLILAVTPANQDLATSDALKLAKEVDPEGLRTIGVLTKLDLMDEGTNARDILENRLFPLRRGYIGVVCRSQRDIDGKLNVRASLAKEREFFTRHPAYAQLASRCGTAYLQEVLNKQLVEHICKTLPELRRKLQEQLLKLERENKQLGMSLSKRQTSGGADKAKLMIQLLRQFSDHFERCLFGSSQSVTTERLSTGARLARIFRELFPLEMSARPMSERAVVNEVAMAIRNSSGIRSGILSDLAIETLAKNRIELLREPIMSCIQLVSRELGLLLDETVQATLASRPALAQQTASLLRNHLNLQEQKTMQHMSLYVDIQMAYINTYHEDLAELVRKTSTALEPAALAKQPDQQTQNNSSPSTSQATTSTQPQAATTVASSQASLSSPAVAAAPKRGWFSFSSSKPAQLSSSPSSPVASNLSSMKGLSASSMNVAKPTSTRADQSVNSATSEELDLIAGPASAALETRVQSVRQLVDAYQIIVKRTLTDLNIKSCNLLLVNWLTDYINFELQADLATDCSQDTSVLMAESPEARSAQEKWHKQYEAHKRALHLLASVDLSEIDVGGGNPTNDNSPSISHLSSAISAPLEPLQVMQAGALIPPPSGLATTNDARSMNDNSLI